VDLKNKIPTALFFVLVFVPVTLGTVLNFDLYGLAAICVYLIILVGVFCKNIAALIIFCLLSCLKLLEAISASISVFFQDVMPEIYGFDLSGTPLKIYLVLLLSMWFISLYFCVKLIFGERQRKKIN